MSLNEIEAARTETAYPLSSTQWEYSQTAHTIILFQTENFTGCLVSDAISSGCSCSRENTLKRCIISKQQVSTCLFMSLPNSFSISLQQTSTCSINVCIVFSFYSITLASVAASIRVCLHFNHSSPDVSAPISITSILKTFFGANTLQSSS